MKAKAVLLVVLLVLVGSAQAVHGSAEGQAVAVGKINWTRSSVCEHPWYPGPFLQYYMTDGCGNELFFHGSLTQAMVGRTIWAEGTLLQNGGCRILDIASLSVCVPPGATR